MSEIKFSNSAIIEVLQTLNKFSNVRGKLGYAISKAKNQMVNEIKPFEEQRNILVDKYGKKDENGNMFVEPNTENYNKFIEEIIPIAQDIQIPINIFQVSREEFEANESVYESEDATVKDFDILENLFVKAEKEASQDKDE